MDMTTEVDESRQRRRQTWQDGIKENMQVFAGYIGLEQMERKNQDGNQPTEAQMENGG